MNEENNEFSEWDMEVAKRIACAVVSYPAGMSYEDLWEQFANQKEEIGTFWLSIAKQVWENLPRKPK
jgi:hypothetical protein